MKGKPIIRTVDWPVIDKVFEMEGGFCLNFSDRTYAAFFLEELGVNIDDSRYSAEGGSKAKRLRYYLKISDQKTVLTTLNALWDYRQQSGVIHCYKELDPPVLSAYQDLLERLGAKPRNDKQTRTDQKKETRLMSVRPICWRPDCLKLVRCHRKRVAMNSRGFLKTCLTRMA